MLRVPGSTTDLFRVKASGGDVRVVYSPMEALKIAQANPDTQRCLLRHRIRNHRARQRDGRSGRRSGLGLRISPCWSRMCWCRRLSSSVGIANRIACKGSSRPAMFAPSWAFRNTKSSVPRFPCADRGRRIRASRPAGSNPRMLVSQLEDGRARSGEPICAIGHRVRATCRATCWSSRCSRSATGKWRGIGPIPQSGLRLREEFAQYDAERVFGLEGSGAEEPAECISAPSAAWVSRSRRIARPSECDARRNHRWERHGFVRRRLRGVLSIQAARSGSWGKKLAT